MRCFRPGGRSSATAPAEALIEPLGWRALFYLLTALSLVAAALVLFVVPEKKLPGEGRSLGRQIRDFGRVFSKLSFWRIALPLVVCHSGYLTLQGLWLGPWLYDVAGMPRESVANHLFATAAAYTVGSVFFGATSDRLARAGVSRMTQYKLGLVVAFAMFLLIAAGVQTGLAAILMVYGFSTISGALAYPLLTTLFPAPCSSSTPSSTGATRPRVTARRCSSWRRCRAQCSPGCGR